MAAIRARGRLIVGVSGDPTCWVPTNPLTGQIEGLRHRPRQAGRQRRSWAADAIQLVVITAADRIPALQQGRVDIVVRNMTMNCARWRDVAFSQVYYQSGQKICSSGAAARSRAWTDLRRQGAHPRARRPTNLTRLAPGAIPSALTTHRLSRALPAG